MALARKLAVSLLVAGVAIISGSPSPYRSVAEAAGPASPVITAQFVPPVQGGTIPLQNGPNCRFQRIRYCKIGVDCPRLLIAACIAPARPVTHADGTVYCEWLVCK
jgi:hypothetical protein